MTICSPRSASTVSLWCIEPDPRPVAMTSTGTNHGFSPVVLQGRSGIGSHRRAAWLKARCRALMDQGSAAPTVDSGGGAGSRTGNGCGAHWMSGH